MELNFEVEFTKRGERYLYKLSKVDVEKVVLKLKQLKFFPKDQRNIKRLSGFKDCYRLRVGKIRVVFKVNNRDKIIWIFGVDYRDKIYKRNF